MKPTQIVASVARDPSYLPAKTLVRLRYRNEAPYTITTGTGNYHVFRMNSPFDPDFSAGGISAKGFSEYAALYTRYVCFGSSIKVTAYNWTSSYAAELVLVSMPRDSALASFNAALAQPNCSRRRILGLPSGSKNQTVLKAYANVAACFGVPKSRVRDDDVFTADTAGNPGRTAYWHIWARNLDQTNPINVQLVIEIIYYCRFFDRKEQAEL